MLGMIFLCAYLGVKQCVKEYCATFIQACLVFEIVFEAIIDYMKVVLKWWQSESNLAPSIRSGLECGSAPSTTYIKLHE